MIDIDIIRNVAPFHLLRLCDKGEHSLRILLSIRMTFFPCACTNYHEYVKHMSINDHYVVITFEVIRWFTPKKVHG